MNEKNRLKTVLKDLLIKGIAANQEAICEHLLLAGFDVNQSKISRLLNQLGAIKVKNEVGDFIYCLPKEPLPLPSNASLNNLIIEIVHNEVLIVIRTAPGAAQLIARLLDYSRENSAILGTVAGDDTIFITPVSIKQIALALEEIRSKLLDLD